MPSIENCQPAGFMMFFPSMPAPGVLCAKWKINEESATTSIFNMLPELNDWRCCNGSGCP